MDEQEKISITVMIAGRPYPLKINVGDELVIRDIVKSLNDKVNHFQLTYNNKDKQDCLAMTLLTYAVELQKSKQVVQSEKLLNGQLDQLEELLLHALK